MVKLEEINQIFIDCDFCDIDFANTIIWDQGITIVKLHDYRIMDTDGEKY